MKTKLYAAFCGTGKTYICNKTNIKAIEIEYWKYKDNNLYKEYIQDIKKYFGTVDYIFISTDPEGLKLLNNEGYEITLIYPQNELRNEYLDRYIERDSPYDFIGTFMKNWNTWINELKEIHYCNHIILKTGQYLKDVITY
jgi:guanylate kinase